MKICLDIRVSTKGGTSTFIENFVRELERVPGPHRIEYVFQPQSISLNGKSVIAATVPTTNRLLEFPWSQWRLPQIIRRGEFDVYHSLKHVGPLACPAHTIYRVPAVGQFLGNYPMRPLDYVYWAHVARRAYRRADLLIAVSDYVRRGLVEHLKIPAERVVTVYNGVDARYRRLADHERENRQQGRIGISPYILCVGNLVPVKNFGTAIRAFALLHHEIGTDHQLVLAGSQRDQHFTALARLVEELHLSDVVHFVGYQTADDLLHLYNRADLLLHPSLHEGFSFTILEAMACGTPIVATATTSIPEAAGDAALYAGAPTDVEGLADCTRRIITDPQLSARLSQRAMARASQFTWQRCVAESIALYNRFR